MNCPLVVKLTPVKKVKKVNRTSLNVIARTNLVRTTEVAQMKTHRAILITANVKNVTSLVIMSIPGTGTPRVRLVAKNITALTTHVKLTTLSLPFPNQLLKDFAWNKSAVTRAIVKKASSIARTISIAQKLTPVWKKLTAKANLSLRHVQPITKLAVCAWMKILEVLILAVIVLPATSLLLLAIMNNVTILTTAIQLCIQRIAKIINAIMIIQIVIGPVIAALATRTVMLVPTRRLMNNAVKKKTPVNVDMLVVTTVNVWTCQVQATRTRVTVIHASS
jgi:hypothetical protein